MSDQRDLALADKALGDIIRLINTEGEDHDAMDNELYEAFLSGHYAGCAVCMAGFIARATLEGKPYPEPEWSFFQPASPP